jgi:carbon-monoxide dehydrogenase large subunit
VAVIPKLIGERVKRREDPRLITGTATYVDDIQLPRMLHAVILRSPHAHARIAAIDIESARKAPGVFAVLIGTDLKEKVGSLPCVAIAEHKPFHPVLALNKVRFVGEPVVAVVATDPYKAQDALDLVEVDYEPLDAVVDPEKALEASAPLIHEEFGTNLVHRAEVANPAVEEAMRQADRVIKLRVVNQRLAPIPMEPRGAVAQWHHASQQLTLWSSTQIPHLLRSSIAAILKLAENRTRVIAPEVGGGFGGKLNVYREEALVAYLAMTLKRPVKWIERRRENFAAATHGRDQIADIEVAVTKDGIVLAMKGKFVCDMGAYLQLFTPLIPGFSGLMMSGCYKIPAVAFDQVMVFTNKMATDAYRGAGRPEAAFIAERAMDIVSAELGLDPVEVRRRNFVHKDAFPYTTSTGLVYDSGDYHAALDKALATIDYKRLRSEQGEARKNGRLLGIGIASYVEICGLGPSSMFPQGVQGWESSTVRIEPDGKVTVLTGISPHGQGQETAFAQMAAEALAIDIDDVNVVHGDTAIVQYGVGTFGSRGLTLGGTAMMMSVGKLQEKLKKIAATMMEAPPDQLTFHNRTIALAIDLEKSIPLQRVIAAAYDYKNPIPGMEPGLDATSFFEPTGCTFPFGSHIALVEVEGETGAVKILRYVAVDDCGRVINPLLVAGQIHGGIAQGIAQALYEEVVYDEGGQLLTATLMDYAVPRADMLPSYELDNTITPSPLNPMGAKGVGEAGTIGSTPCIVNAVMDALAPLGIRHIDMPLRPEKLWRAIRDAKRA